MSGRRHARAFGRQVNHYERGRPDWPEAALDRAVNALGLEPDTIALDLAAGTGKLTRLLVRRFSRVVAVEPDEAMLGKLEEVVANVGAFLGTAEAIPLADGSMDAIFVADAFHWFEYTAALREVARVLRPGGGLVLMWNVWDGRSFDPPLPVRALELLRSVFERAGRPGGPSYEAGTWREAFADAPFAPLREEQLDSEVALDRDEVMSLWLSVSSVAALSRPARDRLTRELRGLLASSYRLPIQTDLYWTRIA